MKSDPGIAHRGAKPHHLPIIIMSNHGYHKKRHQLRCLNSVDVSDQLRGFCAIALAVQKTHTHMQKALIFVFFFLSGCVIWPVQYNFGQLRPTNLRN